MKKDATLSINDLNNKYAHKISGFIILKNENIAQQIKETELNLINSNYLTLLEAFPPPQIKSF